MKVYFTASMAGKQKYGQNYMAVVKVLRKLDVEVFEETIEPSAEYVHKEISDEEKVEYYKKVVKWMNSVDVVVCEASYSSLSIGHEISLALEKNRPVIVLYSEGEAPHFLVGVQSDKLLVQKYNLSNLEEVIKEALEYAASQQDTRFNFFVPPRIASYLDLVAIKKRVPRAVYLRGLILKEMEGDSEFQGEKK